MYTPTRGVSQKSHGTLGDTIIIILLLIFYGTAHLLASVVEYPQVKNAPSARAAHAYISDEDGWMGGLVSFSYIKRPKDKHASEEPKVQLQHNHHGHSWIFLSAQQDTTSKKPARTILTTPRPINLPPRLAASRTRRLLKSPGRGGSYCPFSPMDPSSRAYFVLQ